MTLSKFKPSEAEKSQRMTSDQNNERYKLHSLHISGQTNNAANYKVTYNGEVLDQLTVRDDVTTNTSDSSLSDTSDSKGETSGYDTRIAPVKTDGDTENCCTDNISIKLEVKRGSSDSKEETKPSKLSEAQAQPNEVTERKILLVGRTGCQKRWLGNVLLSAISDMEDGETPPQEYFNTNTSLGHGQTLYNECYTMTLLNDLKLTVVDTPAIPCGQIDDEIFNGFGPGEIKRRAICEIQEAIRSERNRYHAILFVLDPPNRKSTSLNAEDIECHSQLMSILGPESSPFIIFTFVHEEDFMNNLQYRKSCIPLPFDLSFKDFILKHRLSSKANSLPEVRVVSFNKYETDSHAREDMVANLLDEVDDVVNQQKGKLYNLSVGHVKQNKKADIVSQCLLFFVITLNVFCIFIIFIALSFYVDNRKYRYK